MIVISYLFRVRFFLLKDLFYAPGGALVLEPAFPSSKFSFIDLN